MFRSRQRFTNGARSTGQARYTQHTTLRVGRLKTTTGAYLHVVLTSDTDSSYHLNLSGPSPIQLCAPKAVQFVVQGRG
jgi:hypothetical protein